MNLDNRESAPHREKRQYNVDVQFESVASEKHPDRNEDAVLIMKDQQVFGVFDGMGGMAAGDVASAEARNYVAKALEQRLSGGLSLRKTQAELEQVLCEASDELLRLAQEDEKLKGMGTTASIVKIWEGGRGEKKAVIANVGDSRVYIYRADGSLEQITLDDNFISRSITDEQRARAVQDKLNNVSDVSTLTDEERVFFANRNVISRALGRDLAKPRSYAVELHDGDKVFITCDGITDNSTDEEIELVLNAADNNQEGVKNVVDFSRERSRTQHPRAKPDDVTAVLVEPFPSSRSNKKPERAPFWERFTKRREDESHVNVDSTPGQHQIEANSAIRKAVSFDELFKALEAAGGLQGSKQTYDVSELKGMINMVREGKISLDFITKTTGLRQRVADLLEIEKLEKELKNAA